MNELSAELAVKIEYPAIGRTTELNIVEVFLAEQSRLRRIVAGMGINAADCEDMLQDVSVKAMRHGVKIETKQDGFRWLVKVTVNRCLAEHRRRKSFQKKTDEILKRKSQVQIKTADKNLIAAEELDIVRDSLKKLDDDLLGPVVLRYFCDMNSNEISEVLQQNPSTIRGRLREARMILAKNLLERGVQP